MHFFIRLIVLWGGGGAVFYPVGSVAAEIFLCAPISTATVERDFSTMNRILTDLRNLLTTEHME